MKRTKTAQYSTLEKIAVNIEADRTNALYLRQRQGDGDLGEFKFELDAIIPAGILVRVEGEQYVFSAEALVRAAIDAHQKRDKSKKGFFATPKGKETAP